MSLGYDAEAHDATWALVRRGRGPRGKAELTLGFGLAGLVLTIVFAPMMGGSPITGTFLMLSAALLTVAAHLFGWERACAIVRVGDPARIEIELDPKGLRIGQRWSAGNQVVGVELHKVPMGSGRSGGATYHYVVGIVLRWQVIELTFGDLESAQIIAAELGNRLGVGEVIVRSRAMIRGYGFLLALPIFLAGFAESAAGVWIMWLGLTPLTVLLPVGVVVLSNIAAFLLTWWWGSSAGKRYRESEYGSADR